MPSQKEAPKLRHSVSRAQSSAARGVRSKSIEKRQRILDAAAEALAGGLTVQIVEPEPGYRARQTRAAVELLRSAEARASLSGYLTQRRLDRPEVTLKLAMSLDGCIAMADGTSQWITGAAARARTALGRGCGGSNAGILFPAHCRSGSRGSLRGEGAAAFFSAGGAEASGGQRVGISASSKTWRRQDHGSTRCQGGRGGVEKSANGWCRSGRDF